MIAPDEVKKLLEAATDGTVGDHMALAAYLYEIAAAYIALSEEERWISVDERLPEAGVGVLLVENGDVCTGYYGQGFRYMTFDKPFKGFFVHNSGYDGDSADSDCVTHWMPLPDAPKYGS